MREEKLATSIWLKMIVLAFFAAGTYMAATPSAPFAARDVGAWTSLVDRLAEDGLPRDYVEDIFARDDVRFTPQIMADKMIPLIKTKQAGYKRSKVLATSSAARKKTTDSSSSADSTEASGGTAGSSGSAETTGTTASSSDKDDERGKVFSQYFTASMISSARSFMQEQNNAFSAVYDRYGVEPEILTALLLVETRLGSYLGRKNALVTLASMALCEDFLKVQPYLPMNSLSYSMQQWLVRRTREKASWAYEELLAFLEYTEASGLDPLSITSSPYGAIGMCQFMPSNALRFGVDGDGDGRIDLFSVEDALFSTANYLAYHGWKPNRDERYQRKVLYHYNHNDSYTLTIVRLAQKLKEL